jgi:hypothetical protein
MVVEKHLDAARVLRESGIVERIITAVVALVQFCTMSEECFYRL